MTFRRPKMRSIVFLCVRNSARSQMAEGLGRAIFGGDVRIQSAGSEPSHVNPWAVEVCREIGIDLTGQTSKFVGTIDPDSVDTVIRLCDEEVCPVSLSDKQHYYVPIEDPASDDPSLGREQMLARFRRARDEIKEQLASLAAILDRA
ncbi:arsenate reductase ArsC [Polyangium sorediatum]|uniref:Arsenate reductase ArsC n=1 Tax=Polyangium sorediatum TaxID=889274 RepID=A0ABT6P808_9BACT|nr:arsenate reductase ArsC [Polyangium sorediatum]MDI1436696.1 arsenate reductase ArsC [Polyangium sorediatum]